jgi:hypothetical protein
MFGFSFASVDEAKFRQRRTSVATIASWRSGALLTLNLTTNQWEECGTDPALIGGVSLDEVGSGAGPLVPTGRREFPPLTCGACLVTPNVEFMAMYTGTPDIGDFGVTRGADGIWRVDFAKTGASARVRVVDIKTVTEPFLNFPTGTASPYRIGGAVLTGPIAVGEVKCVVLTANAQQV